MQNKNSNLKIVLALAVGIVGGIMIGRRMNAPKTSDEISYAHFNGGEILGADIKDLIRPDVENLNEARKRVVTEKARNKILELAAKSKNMTGQQLLEENRKQLENDPVTDEEFKKYVSNQGLSDKKLSPEQHEVLNKIIRAQKIMAEQNALIDQLVKEAHLELTISN